MIDAYADGHKYLFGARAVVFGEEDFVVGMATFLNEIGVVPVLCASGGKSGLLKQKIAEAIPDYELRDITIRDGVDFKDIEKDTEHLKPNFMIGNSKGYKIARAMEIPIIRAGFPIHDRFGAQRILHIGYRGSTMLLDNIVKTIIEQRQDASPIGYTYI